MYSLNWNYKMCRIFKGNHFIIVSIFILCEFCLIVCMCIIPVAASDQPQEGAGSL